MKSTLPWVRNSPRSSIVRWRRILMSATAAPRSFAKRFAGLGRVDGVPEVELVVHDAPIEASVVEIVETGDTTLVASSVRTRATGRLGSPAIAALFVIMLVAFGAFCRYYPWRVPLPERAEISAHQLPNLSESAIQGARVGTMAARKGRP